MMSRAAQTHLAGRVFETPDLNSEKNIFLKLQMNFKIPYHCDDVIPQSNHANLMTP